MHTHPYFFDSFISALSLTLFFVISVPYSSPSWWHHFCPVISILNWIFHHIFFIIYEVLFAYMLFSSVFLYLFICHLLFCHISFFLSLLLHFWQNYGSIIHMNYIYIHYWLLWHILSTHFIVEILCSFMRYFQCFSSPFLAFIIMSICTHSHGSAKHWLHSSLSIHG